MNSFPDTQSEGKVFTSFETGKVPLQVLILQRIESASVQQVGEVSRPLYCRPEYYRKYHRIKKVGGCASSYFKLNHFKTRDCRLWARQDITQHAASLDTRHVCGIYWSRGNSGQILCFTTTLLPRTAEILARITNVYCAGNICQLIAHRTPLTSRMFQSSIPQNIVWCDRLMKHSPYHYYSFRPEVLMMYCAK